MYTCLFSSFIFLTLFAQLGYAYQQHGGAVHVLRGGQSRTEGMCCHVISRHSYPPHLFVIYPFLSDTYCCTHYPTAMKYFPHDYF